MRKLYYLAKAFWLTQGLKRKGLIEKGDDNKWSLTPLGLEVVKLMDVPLARPEDVR
jgi:hypothetical protein